MIIENFLLIIGCLSLKNNVKKITRKFPHPALTMRILMLKIPKLKSKII